MKHSLHYRLLSPRGLSAADATALVATALGLKRAAAQGLAPTLLRGKHLAVFADDPACEAALAFERAASRLGARVSHVRAHEELLRADGSHVIVLARLYDAIEWEGLSPEAALRLQDRIGIPVFYGLAEPGHPLAGLLSRMPEPVSEEDILYLAQAVLMNSIN